jgi:hypothetical protein
VSDRGPHPGARAVDLLALPCERWIIMMPIEDPQPAIDPDDTAPFARERPPPPPWMERGRAWKVDGATPELARLCAGWAQRGRSLAELASARSERFAYHGHHIRIPTVAVADTRGLLEPMSAKRRELFDRRLAENRERVIRCLVKPVCDHRTPDALFVHARYLPLGGVFHVGRRDWATPEQAQLLDAADYEARPGKLTCISAPDWIGEREAAAWIDLEELGLLLPDEDPCDGRTYVRLFGVMVELQSQGYA